MLEVSLALPAPVAVSICSLRESRRRADDVWARRRLNLSRARHGGV
ncbi:hypothetical protein ACVCAH_37685 [Micromonospora sp. LZ34]